MVMQQPAGGMGDPKGESYVVDDCCSTGNFVATGGGSDDAVPSISESQGDEKVFSYLFGIVNK